MIKRVSYTIILFLLGGFIFCPPILADQISGLTEIYNTPIPAEIRRNFDEYLQNREYYLDSECEHGFIDGEKFIDIYPKKFLVIGLEPNSFGGVWAIIAAEDEMRHAFRLWLYDIDDGVYDLRSIIEIPGHFDEQFVEKLSTAVYSKFWL